MFIYGFGLGMLPQPNSENRPNELLETPIKFVGSDQNRFLTLIIFFFMGMALIS